MELDEIESLGVEVAQAAIDEGGQVRGRVSVGYVRVEPPAGLRDDDHLLARPIVPDLSQDPL